MTDWSELADRLEKALLNDKQALMLHFLRTASPEDIDKIAGDVLPCSEKARASVTQTLAHRLDTSVTTA